MVAFFGERLVLMIGAAVFELGRGDIEDALACEARDLVHEPQNVLV